MKRKRRCLSAPPVEWIDLLEAYADHVRRLRMLWRRGAGDYRPIVPLSVDLEVLEDSPDSEWERLETAETNFDWQLEGGDLDDPHRRVMTVIEEQLWPIAKTYTRELGSWADFQLIAYDEDGEQLFADGRRCRLPRSRSTTPADRPPPSAGSHPPTDTGPSIDLDSFRAEAERLDGRKNQFIERLITDRDWSFDTARQAMGAAPGMLDQAGQMMKESIAYQRSVVRQLQDRASGDIEVRVREKAEFERSRRIAMGLDFGRHLVDTTFSSVIPLANHLAEIFSHRNVVVYPEFETAQQAIAYLYYSLKPSHLKRMFKGDMQAAGSVLAQLDEAARMDVERDALYHISELVMLFRDERFEDNTGPEEQLAARFIIGRFALHRMHDHPSSTVVDATGVSNARSS